MMIMMINKNLNLKGLSLQLKDLERKDLLDDKPFPNTEMKIKSLCRFNSLVNIKIDLCCQK